MEPLVEGHLQKVNFALPKRILVATDLSDAEFLVPHVVAQAKACGAHVTLVHAILPASTFPVENGTLPYIDRESFDSDARSQLHEIARKIESEGISCDVVLKHGFAADVIRDEIGRNGATRLILGTNGRGKWGQLVLGSVANELLGSVNIPVFAVGPHVQSSASYATPRHILHAVSLMGDYQRSAGIAMDVARSYGAVLTLFHVLDRDTEDIVNPSRKIEWAENALSALKSMKADGAPIIHTRVRYGNLVEEILNAAAETNADWLVLGVEGGIPFLPFKNSLAYKVIAAATCPVLAIFHDPYRVERESVDAGEFPVVVG